MSAAAFARKLADAGLDAAAIVAALEAYEAVEEARLAAKREGNRERQARHRAKADVTPVTRDDALQGVTERDTLSLPLSPQTPQTTTHTRESNISTRVRADDFERFWAAYPRKVAKDAARKAFPRAMARIQAEEPLAVILAGIERARPGWTDPTYIPHPATWLNAGQWEDEAPIIRTSQTHDRPDHHNRPSPRNDRLERMLAGAQRAVGPESGLHPVGGADRAA